MNPVPTETPSLFEALLGKPLVRRFADVAVGQYAIRRVRQLDHRSCASAQEQALLRLVRYAQDTRFGRDHDFAGVRSVADYQRRVPLRDYEAFWSEYWREPFPYLHQVTWPDRIAYFTLSSGTTTGATKYIPVSRQMLASNQKAAFTCLSLFLAAFPGTPLFTGRLFFLGGSTDLRDLCTTNAGQPPRAVAYPVLAGDLSGITTRTASPLVRAYTFPPANLALETDWETKMRSLVERSAKLPITMVSGVPSWLLVLFEQLRQRMGRETIAEVWPTLRLVIHGGTRFDPYRSLFEQLIGNRDVHLLETYPASEGFIATQDPRHGLLRLIPDHNLFFEFVPAAEIDLPCPTRHTVANLEVGVPYAVVLTTCAGLWGYKIGDTICFESTDPPLLRFTGRTKYFLSAFGEHLISEEVERAVTAAAEATAAAVVDFHVGPVFAGSTGKPGRHRFFVEFACEPNNLERFAAELDGALCRLNEDYEAHRYGDLAMMAPEVREVRRGGFADWMRSVGKLGGQHKVPRMDNTGELTGVLSRFFLPPDNQ
jgi:acyl-CoA synthetase (AMP-forming)/AMP-acid ligase II